MRLYTPDGLYYPITVKRLLCAPKDDIQVSTSLFDYEYKHKVLQGSDDNKDGELKELTWPSTFQSEFEGKLLSLDVHPGQVITRKTLVGEIEESCTHEVQFGGMCANCGKDMQETTYNTTVKATERAKLNTVHDRSTLLISQDEASKADEEAKKRLLAARKLTLVVDLDQCVIQACVDQTVGEWMNDPAHPNHESLQSVHTFKLPGDPRTYYLKPRPGLTEFLEMLSDYYEMHVYTMATRDYAQQVVGKIDPKGKIFGKRVLSRNESGDAERKMLKRLFPVDTRMVVIIDDRADVWSYIPNVIKVKPYDYFVGIGDINSSFLPKRPEDLKIRRLPDGTIMTNENESSPPATPSPPLTPITPMSPPATNGAVSAVDQLAAMAGKQDENSMQEKNSEHTEALDSQVADRPLLQKQKLLDAANEEAAASPAVEAAASLLTTIDKTPPADSKELAPADTSKYRHNLLADDDNELLQLGDRLKYYHAAFYTAYDASVPDPTDVGRVGELRTENSIAKRCPDDRSVPDAAALMAADRIKVLAKCSFVLSGVVPLDRDWRYADETQLARIFGAEVTAGITNRTTHLIAAPDRRTQKVRQASRKGVWIVSVEWLREAVRSWKRPDEVDYAIHGALGTVEANRGVLPRFRDEEEEGEGLSDSDPEAGGTEAEGEGDGELFVITDGKDGEDLEVAEELERFQPSVGREDSSPTATEHAENWEELNDELAEFLGSDAEDESDSEGSVRSETSTAESTPVGGKRKRDSEGQGGEGGEVNGEEGSRLQKRKKEALGRTSSLNLMAAVGEKGAVAVEDGAGDGAADAGDADAEDEDEDDDLEAALAAEMERQEEEDREDGG